MSFLWPGLNGPNVDYISAPPPSPLREADRRGLVILGSTGSIGTSTLSVVDENPDHFHILGLAAGRNIKLLARQASHFRPPYLAVLDEEHARLLRERLPANYNVHILTGVEGYAALASLPEADLVVSAQVGAAGLPATIAAALAGKTIALANKEALVLAGNLLRRLCRLTGASILPLDSEHFAIFQCLSGRGQAIARLVLTASGGPFRHLSLEEMRQVGVAEALRHPNWKMGRKISIDSATMMNKGLEVIEACQLFGVEPDRVQVLVHPQSIIHSMITLDDNSMLAQLAVPDMRGPIAACLFWPKSGGPLLPPPDLVKIGNLSFEEVDNSRFPAIEIARRALRQQPDSQINSACVVMNAANEMAVELFLAGKCPLTEIVSTVDAAMQSLAGISLASPPLWECSERNIPSVAASIWEALRLLDSRSRAFAQACILGKSAAPDEINKK